MKCTKCGKAHKVNHPHIVKNLTDKGFPTHAKKYKEAHEQADKAEKAKYPKGYNKLKVLDKRIGKHELIGKNTSSGKIEISKKVPPKLRKEVTYHEKTENKILRK